MGEFNVGHVLLFLVGAFLAYHTMNKLEGYSSKEECVRLCPQGCENPIVRSTAFGYLDEDKCKNGCGSSYCPSFWGVPLRGTDLGNLIGK